MKVDEKIVGRLEQLIQFETEIARTRLEGYTQGQFKMYYNYVNKEMATQWGTSCLSILSTIFGEGSDLYKRFNELFIKISKGEPEDVKRGLGILKSAKDVYENGYLFNTQALIEAEIFDDLLEQAEHLLSQNYFLASAVIAGCVLEDCLRKLCDRNSITLPAKATIEPMNVELAKAGIYNKLWQKKITALADLRNKAAHNLGGFTDKDVEDMIRDVRRFMEDYFS